MGLFSRVKKGIGGALFGKGPKQVSTMSPQQQQLLGLLQGGLAGGGALGGALGGFDPNEIAQLFQTGVAEPARRQFQQRTLPGIEQRAIGSGLTRSSGLQRQQLEGEFDLEEMLSSQLAQAQLGAREGSLNRQLQGLGIGLGGQQTALQGGQKGVLEDILGGLGGSFTKNVATGFLR